MKNRLYYLLRFVFFTFIIGISCSERISGSRNNNVFINKSFWDNNPDNNQIKQAILGINSSDKTAYTNSRETNNCDYNNINVVNISNYNSGGIDQIPLNLSNNTIYVLNEGTHIVSRRINIANCSTIIGNGDVNIYSNVWLGTGAGLLTLNNKSNFILDNIKIDGENNGLGGSHSKNNYGVYINSGNNNTINNVEGFNNSMYGLFLTDKSRKNYTINSKFFANSSAGIYVHINAIYNEFMNIEVFANNGNGISIRNRANYNTVRYIRSYGNGGHGIVIDNASFNTISHARSYNNNVNGLFIFNEAKNSFINNSKFFNNTGDGIKILNSSNERTGGYNSINNSQVFNNSMGVDIAYSDFNTVNNVSSYNNDGFGISLYYANNNIYNNIMSFNNDSYGFRIVNSTGKYYGFFKLFSNNILYTSFEPNMSAGNDGFLGRNNGIFSSGGTMNCSYVDNALDSNGYWLNTGTNCENKKRNQNREGYTPLYFAAGSNLMKQIRPVYYNGPSLENSDIEYDILAPIGDLGDDFINGTGMITLTTMTISPGAPVNFVKKSALVKSETNHKSSLSISGVMAIIVSGNVRDGKLKGPVIVNPNSSSAANSGKIGIPENANIKQTIEVGSDSTSLIASGGNFLINSFISGGAIGEEFEIYRSSDGGETRHMNSPQETCILDSNLLCTFYTDHLSSFTFLGQNSSFFINNNNTSTTSQNVTLNISVVGAQKMRFANDNPSGRSSREDYSNTKSRTLSVGTGVKTVYAQFDSNSDGQSDGEDNDTIEYVDQISPICPPGSNCGNLTLEIQAKGGHCEIGNSLDFGQTGFSYLSKDLVGNFLTSSGNNSRYCEDLAGLSYRNVTLQTTDLLNMTTNNPNHTINASNVFMKNPIANKVAGNCSISSGSSLNNRVSISTVKTLFGKSGSYGEACKIQTDNVELKVSLAAAQAVGIYSGTLTIDIPNF